MISPSEAKTVPPGTPGAPTANIPNSTINNTIVPKGGTAPYNILATTITKNVSVKTDPHRWVVAPNGIAKLVISSSSTPDFLTHFKLTGKVAADDIVPTAVIYAGP